MNKLILILLAGILLNGCSTIQKLTNETYNQGYKDSLDDAPPTPEEIEARRQADYARRQYLANSIRNMQVTPMQMPNQQKPKQIDYTCMQNCQRMNYQYAYCESRCSY